MRNTTRNQDNTSDNTSKRRTKKPIRIYRASATNYPCRDRIYSKQRVALTKNGPAAVVREASCRYHDQNFETGTPLAFMPFQNTKDAYAHMLSSNRIHRDHYAGLALRVRDTELPTLPTRPLVFLTPLLFSALRREGLPRTLLTLILP